VASQAIKLNSYETAPGCFSFTLGLRRNNVKVCIQQNAKAEIDFPASHPSNFDGNTQQDALDMIRLLQRALELIADVNAGAEHMETASAVHTFAKQAARNL
jgi:hypothetical protein